MGQSLWIFSLALMTSVQFARVLTDPTDVDVLASRPVDARTLFATRLAQVLAPVLVYGFCSGLPPVLVGVLIFAPLPTLIAYPVGQLCSTAFVLGGASLTLAVCLRIVGPARFLRVIFWCQVAGAMVLMASSQLLPRLLAQVDFGALLAGRPWLGFLFPPLAEHGLYRLLSGGPWRLRPSLQRLGAGPARAP